MKHWPFSFLAVCLALAACSRTPEPPPPAEIVSRAVGILTKTQGFRFSIDRSGAPAYLDANQTISFRRADGVYAAPDQARATVRVIVPGLVAEVSMVAIGDRYWETNFLTREWVELPAGQAFNPADLFDAADGLPPVLETGLDDLAYVGFVELDEIPGQQLFQVSGVLDTLALYDLSFNLIGPAPAEVQLWVHPETFETYRIVIVEPPAGPEQEPTTWQVDFWDFGTSETIAPPGQ